MIANNLRKLFVLALKTLSECVNEIRFLCLSWNNLRSHWRHRWVSRKMHNVGISKSSLWRAYMRGEVQRPQKPEGITKLLVGLSEWTDHLADSNSLTLSLSVALLHLKKCSNKPASRPGMSETRIRGFSWEHFANAVTNSSPQTALLAYTYMNSRYESLSG